MSTSYEEISKNTANSAGKPDSNIANDSNHLGGIPAEQYATKEYVNQYHDNKEKRQKDYIDEQDRNVLNQAKEYANSQIRNQDFSTFAKLTDVQTLDTKLGNQITAGLKSQKEYTDNKTDTIVSDVNNSFKNVENSIKNVNTSLNKKYDELFQSVSNGKRQVAEAITDKGVPTSAVASYSSMATNISRIVSIPDGYVNTKDATASEGDILQGKTAYVNGRKVYGTFHITGNSGPTTEINPNNPYPTVASVELVYGEKSNTIEVNDIGIIDKVSDISSDKNLLVGYDETNKKIKTYLRQSDKTYRQVYNQYGELLTPEYTLEELGITTDSAYTLVSIRMSVMNTDINKSAYECRIAILMVRKFYNAEKDDFICYVYKISTKSGEIQTKNNSFQAGATGSEETFTEYNKWVIDGIRGKLSSEAYTTTTNSAFLTWSPYDYTLAIKTPYKDSIGGGGITKYIFLYQFYDSFFGQEDYSKSVLLKDTIESGQYDTLSNFRFLKGNLFSYYKNSYQNTVNYIRMYDDHFNFIKQIHNTISGVLSNDCLFSISIKKIYGVNLNYTSGTIESTELKDITVINNPQGNFTSSYSYCHFSRDNKYLFTDTGIYCIDFENGTATKVYDGNFTLDSAFRKSMLTDLTGLIDSINSITLIETIPDMQNIIGIKYNNQMFYRTAIKTGICNALASDVAEGKKFIGFSGTIEEGTAITTQGGTLV